MSTAAELTQGQTAEPWRADPYAQAVQAGRGPLYLSRADGWLLPLDVERWCARADDADMTVLTRCRGPVIDMGCGPGRLVTALTALGRPALGVDLSPAAVARTVRDGGTAVCRSVFDRLPGEGRWQTALLIDGNIGIGGDPRALLERAAEIVSRRGQLIVEADPADVEERMEVRVVDGRGGHGAAFPWAIVGAKALLRYAGETAWTVTEQWTAHGRHFAALRQF